MPGLGQKSRPKLRTQASATYLVRTSEMAAAEGVSDEDEEDLSDEESVSRAARTPTGPGDEAVKAGYLLKRGHGWPRKWRRRWFELKGQRLSYYLGPDKIERKGHIDLNGRAAAKAVPDSESCEWVIPGVVGDPKGRTYLMRAETEDDMHEWVALVTKWSCDTATQEAMTWAKRVFARFVAEGVRRGWPAEELAGLEPCIDSMGQVSCADGSIQLPRLTAEIERPQRHSAMACARVHVGRALSDPTFIAYPERGRLQIDGALRPWFYQLVATKNGILYEVQQWVAALEVDGVGSMKGPNYLEVFDFVCGVIFARKPVATDARVGYNTFGERLEAERQVYEEEDWQALHDAYSVLNQLVIAVPSQERRASITPAFAGRLVRLMSSDDARERQALAPILLSLYVEANAWRESEAANLTLSIDMSDDVALQPGMRAALLRGMLQFFREAIYETMRKEGLNELLNVLACVLADIDAMSTVDDELVPIFDALRETMLPLHKAYCVMEYHEQLCTCVFHYIGLDVEGGFRARYINGLLNKWPVLDSDKEELFLVELEELLDFMSPQEEQELAMPLARVFARVMTGPCFCNAKKALEVMLSAGALFNMVTQSADVFAFVMGAIHRACDKLVPIIEWDDIETGVVAKQVREMYQAEFEFAHGADAPVMAYRSSYSADEMARMLATPGINAVGSGRLSGRGSVGDVQTLPGYSAAAAAAGYASVRSVSSSVCGSVASSVPGSSRAEQGAGGDAEQDDVAPLAVTVVSGRSSLGPGSGRRLSAAAHSVEEGRVRARTRANSLTPSKRLSHALSGTVGDTGLGSASLAAAAAAAVAATAAEAEDGDVPTPLQPMAGTGGGGTGGRQRAQSGAEAAQLLADSLQEQSQKKAQKRRSRARSDQLAQNADYEEIFEAGAPAAGSSQAEFDVPAVQVVGLFIEVASKPLNELQHSKCTMPCQ
eukprot:g3329.t1